MTQVSSIDLVKELYEPKIRVARIEFGLNEALSKIMNPHINPALLEAFLIYFNALGVGMTEPVESWIERAGESCKKIGLPEIGKSLCAHAKHEAGHHHMMINDTKFLVKHWNAKRKPTLDAEELIRQPITEGTNRYIELHENIIVSSEPYTQLAVELEIEGLSVSIGPSLIEQCKKVLDSEILNGLSFLEEHIAIDVSHTHFNEKQLNNFLSQHPEYLTHLVDTGKEALEAYGMFLNDCLSKAEALIN